MAKKDKTYIVHLPPELHERWKQFCRLEDRRVGEYTAELIRRELEKPADNDDAAAPPPAPVIAGPVEPLRGERREVKPLEHDPWTSPPFWKRD